MTRLPVRWANYPGDCRGQAGRFIVGPNTTNEHLHPVTEDYAPAANRTRVGFAYGLPEVTPELAEEHAAYLRIRGLFVATPKTVAP